MSEFKKNILVGTLWSILGQMGTMIIALVANVILARILTPFEFGQIGIIMFFIFLANIFTESGFSGALISRREVTREDYSTVFVFNLAVSILCFFLIVLFSGAIARFYGDTSLKNILITSSLILIINAFQITQNVRLVRDLKFKKKSIYRFVAVLLSSCIGIVLALLKFGVYAIVIMQLLAALFTTILLWVYEGVFFSFAFNKKSFKSLFAYGVNTTLASLLDTAFNNIYQLIIGKYFSINQAGLFYQAKRLQEVPVGVINMTTQSVVFASLSKVQGDKEIFIRTYNKIVSFFTVVAGLITALIYTYSYNILLVFYGEKWAAASFNMQLLTIASFFFMQETFNLVIFKTFNQTRQIFYLEVAKKIIQTLSIIIGIIKMDMSVLLYGFVVTSMISYLINFYYSRKILGSVHWYEIILILKVVFISITTVFLTNIAVEMTGFNGLYAFVFLPFMVLLYFTLVHIASITNIIKEIKGLLRSFKK